MASRSDLPAATTDDERIDATDVGLPAGTALPWRLWPAHGTSPLLVSFPHVGLAWPAELGPPPPADFARNADFEVQSLYGEAPALGATCIEAVYSRLLVDLNRASDDISRAVVPDHPRPRPRRRPGMPDAETAEPRAWSAELDHPRPGRGVVWSHALGDVRLLSGPLSFADFRARIERFHEPYCRAIEILMARRRDRFGYAILLDAHSMPCSVGVDLVVGTLAGTSCARRIERLALDALGDAGTGPRLRLRLNDPYHGGELVRRFGRPAEGFHALQLEVSRGLYMDERTTTLWTPAVAQRGLAAYPGGAPRGIPSAQPRDGASRAPAEHPAPHPGRAGKAHGTSAPPSPRHAADFAELRRRVSCLIQALAQGEQDLSTVGTSRAPLRATEPTTRGRVGVRLP